MKHLKNLFISMLFSISLTLPSSNFAMGPGGAGPQPTNPLGFKISDILSVNTDDPALREQLKSMGLSEAEINEVKTAQEQLRALDPNELNQLQTQFDDAITKMSQLNESDLEYLKDASEAEIEEFMKQRFDLGEQPKAEPTPPIKKEEIKRVAPKISSKHQKALDLIETIIHGSDLLLVKISTMPEFPVKFEKWEKAGKTRFGMPWNVLKSKIDQMIQQLRTIITRDAKTKEYKFLDELMKNEALYNNLSKIKDVIETFEPQVEELEPLPSVKISKKSKHAIQKLLNQYIEALSILKIPAALDAVIETYEPKAKKLREEEEAATKRAIEESKRPRLPRAKIEAGFEEDFGYMPSVPAGYPDLSYPTYKGSGATPARPTPTTPSRPAAKKPSAPRPGVGGADKGPSKVPTKDGDKIGVKPDSKKVVPRKPSEKPRDAKDAKPVLAKDQKLENLTSLVQDKFEEANKAIKKNKSFLNLKRHLTDDSEIDIDFVNEDMATVRTNLNLAHDYLKDAKGYLDASKAHPHIRKMYKEKIGASFKKHAELEKFLKELEAIKKEFTELHKKITPAKKYTYFQIEVDPTKELEELFTQDEQETFKQKIQEQDVKSAAEMLFRKAKTKLGSASKRTVQGLLDNEQYQPALKTIIEALTPKEDASVKKVKQEIKNPGILAQIAELAESMKNTIDTFDKEKQKEVKPRPVLSRMG